MTIRIRMTAALLGLGLMAGCGGAGGLTGALQGAIAPLVGTQPTAAPVAAGASGKGRADPSTLRRVGLNTLGLTGTATRLIDNGVSASFAGPQGFTYTMRDGMLVSTRGLGDDLMATDARQSRAALRAGGGQARRVHETLDGLDRIERAEFDCTVTPKGVETVDLGTRRVQARRFDESCRGAALLFDNYYWLDAAGEIISSRQFVSRGVAYLRSNDL
ncbi:YjbF family lipoprotein [Limimaricola litoreus]|uniref:YjbF family lipoprotein n=1 Tax=Limimaricola litoreus TaxID=2955316 RepID=A0A9X2FXY0_9RHOB|nr:YjbF family lipoprotein [Limimaricola litoreus]MCP1170496.1 YjbF family lipoprotein [Limimaricola litoreus]